MGTQLHSWWQNIKQHPLISVGIGVTIAALIVFTLVIFKFGWDWTGFTGGESNITITSTSKGITTAKELQPAKTFWDWLELLAVLAIPAVVGFGVTWFTRTQQLRDQKHEKLQRELEQEAARVQQARERQLADERAERERKAAEQQAELERELTRDNQRENLLQAYIDKMSELLLEKNLRESSPEDEVRTIARVRTITILFQLDAIRIGYVFAFLREAGLMSATSDSIISLKQANLRTINFSQARLEQVDLSGADLSGADLSSAKLSGANLSQADLSSAKLNGADLGKANLREANLRGADLRGADLNGTNFSEANFSEADLSEVSIQGKMDSLGKDKILPVDLSGAKLGEANLSGAILRGANLSEALQLHLFVGSVLSSQLGVRLRS